MALEQESGPGASPVPLSRRVALGAYADNEPWPDNHAHYALEAALGTAVPTLSWFQDWHSDWLHRQAADAATQHRPVLIGWAAEQDGNAVAFADILAGHYDTFLARYFTAAKNSGLRLALRPFWEMNGDWYPWSLAGPARGVQSAQQWTATWRYLVDFQRRIGGNVSWVWCANYQDRSGNAAEQYFPGVRYVDVLGIDAYNNDAWQSPYEVIQPMYRRVTALHPDAPVWLCEVGSREGAPGEPHDKAAWLTQLSLERHWPRITLISFFHKDQYRLDSSPQALAAARRLTHASQPV